MGKKRQFTMERPEPHCLTLLFWFAFQVESFFPNFSLFLFILSVRRSVSSAYVPDNATQLAMCLRSLCTESKDLWSAENFISVSNPRWRTKHVSCSLDKICQERGTYAALSLHGNVLWVWNVFREYFKSEVWAFVFWLNDAHVCFVLLKFLGFLGVVYLN